MLESRNFLRVIAGSDSAQIDIVAVHGLNYTDRENHAELTWTASNGKMWLRDFLPLQLPNARILLFGYNAAVTFEVSAAGVDEQAENLLNRLRGKRKGLAANRPIIFICYSLGGIIVKRALVGARLDQTYESIRNLCYGIAFFGTPHNGGNFSYFTKIASSTAGSSQQNTFQEAITKDSLFAEDIIHGFRHQLEDRYVVTIYETLPMQNLGVIIVDKKSATLGLPGARERLLALDADHENLCKFSDRNDDDYEQVGDNIRELAEKVIEISTGTSNEDHQQRPEILKWLSDIPIKDHHSFVSSDRLEGTGEWLFKKPEFIEWKECELPSILWLHGIAGAGKSKLASLVVDEFHRSRRRSHALAYFYCNYKEDDRRDPGCIFRALVKQLATAEYWSTLPPQILALYRERVQDGFQSGPLKLEESRNLVLELTANFEQTIICIDALDECHKDTREKLLLALQHVLRSTKSRVKIFVTSRDDDDIVLRLEDTPNIYIKSSDNTGDINFFIETEIEKCIRRKKILRGLVGPELRTKIIKTLIDGACGMFLWAHLQILSICKETTATAIERALNRLPKDLTETFKDILTRIDGQSSDNSTLAKRALNAILCAQLPLSPEELCEALYIQPMERKRKDNSDLNEMAILAICQNLVVIDEELQLLRFAHLSIQDFLREEFGSSYGHIQLAEICLTILCWPNHEIEYLAANGSTTHAFAKYAILNWATHTRLSGDLGSASEEQPLMKLQKEFLKLCPAYRVWCKAQSSEYTHELETYDVLPTREECFIAPLLVACHFGLLDSCRYLLSVKADRGRLHWKQKTSLHYAADQGHEPVVEELLKKITVWKAGWLKAKRITANRSLSHWVNCGRRGLTPLCMAASNGHDGVVRKLLQIPGVDVGCSGSRYHVPLVSAARGGHDGIIQQLLQIPGVEADCQDNHRRTPLVWAAENGYSEVVRRLLRAGADVNHQDKEGRAPLLGAAVEGHDDVVKQLLQVPGVNTNTKDYRGYTPLIWASRNGYKGIVRQLLQTEEVDVNCKANDGFTPLLFAACGHDDVVKQLLQVPGVNTNTKDYRGYTPLIWASRNGYKGIVRQLLQTEEVDVNCKANDGFTPLLFAACGHDEVVKQLLQVAGVDVNCKDSDGWTPLIYSAKQGHYAIVKQLLQVAGVDVNHKDKNGWTAILWAALSGHPRIVQQLLQVAGVDVNGRTDDGRTLLFQAAHDGNDVEVGQLLQAAGVDVNSKTTLGVTPIIEATSMGHSRVLKQLLQVKGLNVNCKDNFGRTPLLCAAGNGHGELVQQLLQMAGVEFNCKDNEGRTPVLRAAENGDVEIVGQLLKVAVVDINLKDKLGLTPLMVAAKGGYTRVVKLLLQKAGVNLQSKDKSGRTALAWAEKNGYDEVMTLLSDAGADE